MPANAARFARFSSITRSTCARRYVSPSSTWRSRQLSECFHARHPQKTPSSRIVHGAGYPHRVQRCDSLIDATTLQPHALKRICPVPKTCETPHTGLVAVLRLAARKGKRRVRPNNIRRINTLKFQITYFAAN